MSFVLGGWANAAKTSGESWVASGDALVGLGWGLADGKTQAFEVMIVHRDASAKDAPTLYTAMPGGAQQVDFTAAAIEGQMIELANPEHDDPKVIRYRRDGDRLAVSVDGDDGERALELRRVEIVPAPALADADRAFDEDSAARAGDAWAERFEERGAMWSRGSSRVVGPTLVKVAIDDLHGRGRTLRWQPEASAMSPAGDLGLTTGPYQVIVEGKTVATGTYVTVWRRDAAGAWKIAFDTGL